MRDNLVPALAGTRGLPLARSVHQRLARVALIERLTAEPNLTEVVIDDEKPSRASDGDELAVMARHAMRVDSEPLRPWPG